ADQRDLEIADAIFPDVLDNDFSSLVAEVKAMLDGFTGRLGIHGPFRSLPLDAYDPATRAVVQNRLKQGLEFANAIGATHMVVHSPFAALGHYRPDQAAFVMENARETLVEVIPVAEQAGCTLVIETIFDYNPVTLLEFVRSFDSDFVKMSLDVGHAFIMHTALDAAPPDYYVHAGGADLAHLHLQDTDGYSDRHWIPGDGNVNWRELFTALTKLDHTPRLIVEVDTKKGHDPRLAAKYFESIGVAR
ncbi:MAG: sugar phosphate isomerase/epimerase family protein, partial [Chloroflexota bacterium]